jgi:dienelactone hydrolase
MLKQAFLFVSIAPFSALAAQNPTIAVRPSDTLIDQQVAIVVSALPPRTQVVIRSYIRTDSATYYAAEGTYLTDDRGELRLDRDASRGGTFAGIDPMGLFWSGRRITDVADPALRSLQAVNPPQPYQVAFMVTRGDTVLARTIATRRFGSADVREEEVRNGDVVGRLFLPSNPRGAPVVVVLGGSEGGYESSSFKARMLAARGFVAFAQGYFRAEGLREELASVPVERVQRAIRWLQARRDINAARIGVLAHSRGTELALLSANQFPEVRSVVVSGTSVTTGSGLTRNGEPHAEAAWTFNNQPLPVMQHRPPPEALAQFSKRDPVRLRLLFEPALRDAAAVEKAAIPVRDIRADVMVISGVDDQMGPADVAGDMLLERLARTGHQGKRVHLKYPEAGHVINLPYMPTAQRLVPWRFAYGGTPAGYARADADSWTRLMEFLRASLVDRR